MIMFEQVINEVVVQPLFMALQWERDRVRNGGRAGVHLEKISKYVILTVDGIERICRITDFDHDDVDVDDVA
ncbi:hypothetical protein [Rhizobium sp. SG741]|uniref:hypothetical protein n=1 Tax=Rhizobium sp. SG741 TaxID=2587114 RepID=UPI0014454462|nr:hypothetical protein [Rhizobium sp. SG741]NKJ03846.1 hypothetical protein [Rhizobium sp. SG741]